MVKVLPKFGISLDQRSQDLKQVGDGHFDFSTLLDICYFMVLEAVEDDEDRID